MAKRLPRPKHAPRARGNKAHLRPEGSKAADPPPADSPRAPRIDMDDPDLWFGDEGDDE